MWGQFVCPIQEWCSSLTSSAGYQGGEQSTKEVKSASGIFWFFTETSPLHPMNIAAWANGTVGIGSVHTLFFHPFCNPQYLPRAFCLKASYDVLHSAECRGASNQYWRPEIPIQEIILCPCCQGHLSCSKGCCVQSVSCGCGKGQELLLSTTSGWNRVMQVNLQDWKKEREERGFFLGFFCIRKVLGEVLLTSCRLLTS